jgi:uncharacterized protein (TIGR03435 family)
MNENVLRYEDCHAVRCSLTRITVIAMLIAVGLACRPLRAQDIAGTWQGSMQAGKEQHIVVKISKNAGAGWQGVVYSLDASRADEGRATTQMSLQGAQVRFEVAPIESSYQGKLSADGTTIAGTWTQSGTAYPLNLARVAGDAAWEIPRANTLMTKDADPDWDVVSVKARDPNEPSNSQSTGMKGRQYTMTNRTVETMLLFAYGMNKTQLVGGPSWIEKDRWDVQGVPNIPGHPNLKQAQILTRKVLEERFGLKVHKETKEMAVYAISVAKGGEKMSRSVGDPNGGPDYNESSNSTQVTMSMTNISMGEFAPDLGDFLDRPAVDQTGLTGRYDFQLKWTSDESRAPTDSTAPPGLFTAIQQQLGLKLEPAKAPVELLIVDAVQRPSAN